MASSVSFSILKTYQAIHGRYMWYALKIVTVDTYTRGALWQSVWLGY